MNDKAKREIDRFRQLTGKAAVQPVMRSIKRSRTFDLDDKYELTQYLAPGRNGVKFIHRGKAYR